MVLVLIVVLSLRIVEVPGILLGYHLLLLWTRGGSRSSATTGRRAVEGYSSHPGGRHLASLWHFTPGHSNVRGCNSSGSLPPRPRQSSVCRGNANEQWGSLHSQSGVQIALCKMWAWQERQGRGIGKFGHRQNDAQSFSPGAGRPYCLRGLLGSLDGGRGLAAFGLRAVHLGVVLSASVVDLSSHNPESTR